MSLLELFLIGIGLSMDACAVSICKGLSHREMSWKKALVPGIYFGVFQGVMPVLGYFLGAGFKSVIEDYDHWVAFVLLVIIGLNMIKESREGVKEDSSLGFKAMVPLAVATSIDALTVGVSFGLMQVTIVLAAIFIGCTTFVISVVGFKMGNLFGAKYKSGAEVLGGIILILIGAKILIEHLGIL